MTHDTKTRTDVTMKLQTLLAALSPLQIKRNVDFLGRQKESSLRVFYITGVLIRLWTLYYYALAVAETVSSHLLSVGWVEMLANGGGYAVAALATPLAVLSLRGWLSGFCFINFSSMIGAVVALATGGQISFNGFLSTSNAYIFGQTLLLLPSMLLQFSMFKRSALKVRKVVKSSRTTDYSHAKTSSLRMMSGPEFYDMHSGSGSYSTKY